MSRFITAFKLLGLIIAASLLASCSAIKLAYNQAPELTYWWLDGYVDWNDAQSLKVRNELAALHSWHRTQELPKIADFLSRNAALMPSEVSPAQACTGFEQIRKFVDTATERALPAAADLALSLSPEQLQKLRTKYAKVNADFERDYIKGTAKERLAKRMKQAVERSEMIYGSLQEPQLAVIERAIENSSFDAALTLKDRQRRQQELLALLAEWGKSKPSTQQAESALRAYVQRSMVSPNAAYKTYTDKLTQEACASFSLVHASTSAAQRAKAVQTLKDWEADAKILAANK